MRCYAVSMSSKDSGGSSFSSFDALRKATHDGPEKELPAPAEEKGWTLLSGDEEYELTEEELAALPAVQTDIPDRISGRPSGFGPMDTGPDCYRDPKSEELGILRSFRLRTIFPKDVLEETASLPSDPRPEDIEGRLDLRDQLIFTVDGADAKDYDDAIQIEPMEQKGCYRISVHIADVSHYVCEGTILDDEALARGTSVYLADQVVPMLPEELSNGLCSLVPDRDRLAFSVIMEFDAAGERTASHFAKSVIRSKKRATYRVVQELLDGKDTEETRELAPLKEALGHFKLWTRKQQALRDAKGSMRMQSKEKRFRFDDAHEPVEIFIAANYFSQTLIEETALAANQAVGDFFRQKGLPTIYRVHPEKDPEEAEKVMALLEKVGIRVPKKERLSGRDIGRMITLARKRVNAEALVQRIMGLVEKAVYEVKDHEDVATHWGLARKAYLHFTSPIRRYPDLIVHRWLNEILNGDGEKESELRGEGLLLDLNSMATHASHQSSFAEMAERAVFDLKVCQLMEPMIGQKLPAKILRVNRAGMEIELVGLHVTGFLPSRTIGDRPKFEGSTLTIQQGKRLLSFTEGYSIGIIIEDVDFLKLQVLLALAT